MTVAGGELRTVWWGRPDGVQRGTHSALRRAGDRPPAGDHELAVVPHSVTHARVI